MKKIAVLIISCDKYSDLWSTCSKMFNLNWPDCPYEKFILTNDKEYSNNNFTNISVGKDIDWSSNLKKALIVLKNRDYEYVFSMVEDYYFDDKINTHDFQEIAESFMLIKGNFLRMHNAIDPKITKMMNPYFGKVENHTPYRQTCAFSLWRIEVLDDLLVEGENAWEFEKIGVSRGFSYEGFYANSKNMFKTINLVIKGKIVPIELRKIRAYFPDLIFTRDIMSSTHYFGIKLIGGFKLFVLNYLPTRFISKIYFQYVNNSENHKNR